MALTIRKLSEGAEKTLAQVQNENEHINTSTKAIEFVLENYISIFDDLEIEKNKSKSLAQNLDRVEDKLNNIAYGFNIITNMIAK
jgi:hypothetical protein